MVPFLKAHICVCVYIRWLSGLLFMAQKMTTEIVRKCIKQTSMGYHLMTFVTDGRRGTSNYFQRFRNAMTC